MIGETKTEYSRRGQEISSALRRDRTRNRILAVIATRTTATAVRIATDTGLSASTIRRHLSALSRAGVLVAGPHPHDARIPVYALPTGGGHGRG